MGNAFIGLPLDLTPRNPSDGYQGSFVNVTNDEPGLVAQLNSSAVLDPGSPNTVTMRFYTQDVEPIDGFLMLGMPAVNCADVAVWVRGFLSAYDQDNNVNLIEWSNGDAGFRYPMSTNRSSAHAKCLVQYGGGGDAQRYRRYWTFYFRNETASPIPWELWRIIPYRKIQPEDNVEVGAQFGIDDRSSRTYTRAGGRNIDPTTICPTVSATWPWLSEDEAKRDFVPLTRRYGATYPAIFCLDADDHVYGEDYIIYGDMEKNQVVTFEDGDLYSYQCSLVAIAP